MGLGSEYNVIATIDVESDLDEFVLYLLMKKRNEQAANNLIDDYLETIEELRLVAGSLKYDDDPKCAALGYHRIHLRRHQYFLLYRLEDNEAIVDRMFHDLQDYRNQV